MIVDGYSESSITIDGIRFPARHVEYGPDPDPERSDSWTHLVQIPMENRVELFLSVPDPGSSHEPLASLHFIVSDDPDECLDYPATIEGDKIRNAGSRHGDDSGDRLWRLINAWRESPTSGAEVAGILARISKMEVVV